MKKILLLACITMIPMSVYAWNDWSQQSSGSSGGGATITSTGGAFNSQTYKEVTHGAVDLDSDKINFVCLVQLEARTGRTEANPAVATEANWTIPNQNSAGATWVDEAGSTGHFSLALGGVACIGESIKIAGTVYTIEALTGNGTGAGAVELSGDPGSNAAITWVHGILSNGTHGSIELSRNAASKIPINNWFYLTSTSATSPTFLNISFMDDLNSMTHIGGFPAGTTTKWAISHNSGTTWYYPSGEATWATMTMTEWATKGGLLNGSSSNFRSADDADVTDAGWSANLGAGPIANGETVMLAIAMHSTDADVFAYVQQYSYIYDEPAFWQQLNIASVGAMQSECVVRRTSTTTAVFYNNTMTSYLDSNCIAQVNE